MKDLPDHDTTRLALGLFDAFAAGDLDLWQAHLAPGFTFAYPGMPDGHGAAAARGYNQPFCDAFTDWQTEVHAAATHGETVFLDITVTTTLAKPLVTPQGTLPGTGKRASVRCVVMARIRDGRVLHEATFWNVPDLMAQILPA